MNAREITTACLVQPRRRPSITHPAENGEEQVVQQAIAYDLPGQVRPPSVHR